ncbi:MAG: hypothetical protein AB7E80_01150 [Hyphomicrobiaceae bacterium]
MVLFVTLLVAATIAAAALWLAPRLGRGRLILATDPDSPHPFGWDTSWIAVRSSDTMAVVDALGLEAPEDSNWNSGLGSVYDRDLGRDRIFVSPPVEGWTFAVGLALPGVMGPGFVDKCAPLLSQLAAEFDDVQYYLCYPELDLFAWVRFEHGVLVRAFAMTEQGIVWNRGAPTRPERALGLSFYELRGVKERQGDAGGALLLAPTEDHVLNIAASWGLDPSRLGQRRPTPESTLGMLALAPRAWTVERIRRSA